MTYKEAVDAFLKKVDQIYKSSPKRREPGDGSDGYCDCIGLIIGAIRRMGLKWTGIHGSNWAARKESVDLRPIKSQSDLEVGDLVYKSVPKGHKNWALPKRYREGNRYYNGDTNDYYHVGVVYSVDPFQIKHMSAKMTTDTKVNVYYPWTHHAKSRHLKEASNIPAPTPTSGEQAVLVAPSGKTVNLRRTPSLKGALMMQIPLGTIVNIISPGEEWCKVTFKNKTGYMMAKFLDIIGDGKGNY